MAFYHVSWEIELDAECPEEAARQALSIQRDCGSLATVFTVTSEGGECERVDITALDEE